jgi:hypothetical protein
MSRTRASIIASICCGTARVAEVYQYLDSLRTMLKARRDGYQQRVGHGLEEKSYREYVGRIKECTDLIEKVSEQIKSINGDSDAETKRSTP